MHYESYERWEQKTAAIITQNRLLFVEHINRVTHDVTSLASLAIHKKSSTYLWLVILINSYCTDPTIHTSVNSCIPKLVSVI